MTSVETYRTWAEERTERVLQIGPQDRLIAMVVGSLDSRATIDGRSGGLSSPPDRALLRAWRSAADLLLVGARTLEQERYGSIIPEVDRESRESRGQTRVPRVVTISRSMSIDVARVMEAASLLPLTIYTASAATAPTSHPSSEIVSLPDAEVESVIADARRRYSASTIVCEGGPTLLAKAAEQRCLTDISLTVAPVLVGSGPHVFEAHFDEPEAVRLVEADDHEGSVFAHYGIGWSE
jgi:riboflavin biosynthesis pyrimidine reductase